MHAQANLDLFMLLFYRNLYSLSPYKLLSSYNVKYDCVYQYDTLIEIKRNTFKKKQI